MPNTWNVLIQSWLIKDACYADFAVGQLRDFAIMFNPERICTTRSEERAASAVNNSGKYLVTAEVEWNDDRFVIIDFGLRALGRQIIASPLVRGQVIEGTLWLSVDDSSHEELASTGHSSGLVNRWLISGIRKEYRERSRDQHHKRGSDSTAPSHEGIFVPVERTHGCDDDVWDTYILSCRQSE